MHIRKPFFDSHAMMAFVMAAMLAFPCVVEAGISGEPADEPRAGRVSDEEIALLVEQQKLLVPSFLAMQQKLKAVQDELEAVKLKLAHLGDNPPHAAMPISLEAAGAPHKKLKQAADVNQAAELHDSPYLHEDLAPALGLVLFMLTLWLGLRYSSKIKSRNRGNWQQDTGTNLKTDAYYIRCVRQAS